MRLCVFAGTFNPIHNAHLMMAQYVIENFGFDKILFIPAYKPPHKDYDNDMCTHRLNLVKIATRANPHFEVSDIEYLREGKSYTYLTILELYKKYNPEGKICFIIGTDAFEKIDTWYETEKLKTLIDFIVFIRDNKPVNFEKQKSGGYNFRLAKMEFVDISSTELREKLACGIPVNNLIPQEEEEYIKKHGLYKN